MLADPRHPVSSFSYGNFVSLSLSVLLLRFVLLGGMEGVLDAEYGGWVPTEELLVVFLGR
jgi:hypothetical protein